MCYQSFLISSSILDLNIKFVTPSTVYVSFYEKKTCSMHFYKFEHVINVTCDLKKINKLIFSLFLDSFHVTFQEFPSSSRK